MKHRPTLYEILLLIILLVFALAITMFIVAAIFTEELYIVWESLNGISPVLAWGVVLVIMFLISLGGWYWLYKKKYWE